MIISSEQDFCSLKSLKLKMDQLDCPAIWMPSFFKKLPNLESLSIEGFFDHENYILKNLIYFCPNLKKLKFESDCINVSTLLKFKLPSSLQELSMEVNSTSKKTNPNSDLNGYVMKNAVRTLEFLDNYDYLGYYFQDSMTTVDSSNALVEDTNPGPVPNPLKIVDTFFSNIVQLSISGLDYSYASGAGIEEIPYYR